MTSEQKEILILSAKFYWLTKRINDLKIKVGQAKGDQQHLDALVQLNKTIAERFEVSNKLAESADIINKIVLYAGV